MLTQRIKDLTEHLKEHKHDHHSRRGLFLLVGQRRRLLGYLQDIDIATVRSSSVSACVDKHPRLAFNRAEHLRAAPRRGALVVPAPRPAPAPHPAETQPAARESPASRAAGCVSAGAGRARAGARARAGDASGAGGEQVGVPALGHVGVGAQAGLEGVLAVERVDGVGGVLRDAAGLGGELGRQIDQR